MFCPKCGTEVTEGVFCPKCGTKIANDVEEGRNTEVKTEVHETVDKPKTSQQTSTKTISIGSMQVSSKTIGIIATVAVALIVVILIACFHTPTINLNKYVTVEFNGYESLGRATATVDWNSIEKDYGKKIKIDKKAIKKQLKAELGSDYSDSLYSGLIDEYLDESATQLLRECVSGNLDKSNGLSNGDEVIYSWNCDDELVDAFLGCKLKYSDKSFKASGFEQVGTFNPFDGVTISYSGIAPNGSASVECQYSNDYQNSLNYQLDKRNELNNGDTVTLTVSVSGSEENFVANYGKLPSPTEQTYTVEGLMAYITTTDDIPDNLMVNMQNQAEDIIKANVANNWSEFASLKSLVYLGNYYLTSKKDSWDNNRCVLVYKITSEETMETVGEGTVVEDTDIYYYVQFVDLMTEEDGSGAVDITNTATTNNRFTKETEHVRSTGWWTQNYSFTYYGFESVDLLYNEVVTKNLESYSHEDNVTE